MPKFLTRWKGVMARSGKLVIHSGPTPSILSLEYLRHNRRINTVRKKLICPERGQIQRVCHFESNMKANMVLKYIIATSNCSTFVHLYF